MTQPFTKENAKNIFYGGTVFFLLLFLELAFNTSVPSPGHSWHGIPNIATELGKKIALGKTLWEKNDCVGCHTLRGDGAYFAPELGNVYQRYDQNSEGIKKFIRIRPSEGIEYRRSMPQFNLSEEELDALASFLKYNAEVDTAGWPPNKEG